MTTPTSSTTSTGPATPRADTITIAHCTRHEEFQRCVELQGSVWGYDSGDIVPRRLFLLASKIGGQVVGAFDAQRVMVGFAMALPAIRNGMPYLHSHMLAVLPEYRNAGLGQRLKLAQRDDALARGFDRMEWTFDPLEIKNAYLNLCRLGAITRRYAVDFYGPSSSALQAGLPTDRLYAEWWLRSPRVVAALAGKGATSVTDVAVERVVVPHQIAAWKRDPASFAEAAALQQKVRSAMQAGFARGLTALGFERDGEGNGAYVLGAGAGDLLAACDV